MTSWALKLFFFVLSFSAPPPFAKEGIEISSEKMLKTATVKDFISLEVIPIPKFGAKIRGEV
jgi:hypothetical protein